MKILKDFINRLLNEEEKEVVLKEEEIKIKESMEILLTMQNNISL